MKKKLDKAVESVKQHEADVAKNADLSEAVAYNWDKVISTGSTLLDLAISGKRTRYGGIPGGILVEVYGASGCGKSALLSEMCGYSQSKGGDILFLDPEARLDGEHAKIYGMHIPKEHYQQPDTVTGMFEALRLWEPAGTYTHVCAADSLAALSTELELKKGDKMGMRRAKEFSQELRKVCRFMQNENFILACSNQIRQSDYGETTPGGEAVKFYASLRIRLKKVRNLTRSKKVTPLIAKNTGDKTQAVATKGTTIEQLTGIHTTCYIAKSSIDKPFRSAPLFILFDYGIDDIRGNLVWLKGITGSNKYMAVDKEYAHILPAIEYIEQNDLEHALKDIVVDTWNYIEDQFATKRKPKVR